MQKEQKASGISPDHLSEVDQILEEIQEVITSNAISPCAASDKEKSESERARALAIRNRAMTSSSSMNKLKMLMRRKIPILDVKEAGEEEVIN